MSKFHEANLNLLPTLRKLLELRSVSRAARDLGITQSAVSHSLRKLRTYFADPLLVTGPDGPSLTPRAQELLERLGRSLDELDAILREPGAFEPHRSSKTFIVGTTDYFDTVFLPELCPRLAHEAPTAKVRTRRGSSHTLGRGLARGDFHVGVGVGLPPQSGILESKLLDETFVSCVRKGHPLAKQKVDVDMFTSHAHVLVSVESAGEGVVDIELRKMNKKILTRVTVPSFLAAPHLVMNSDLVLTAPRRAVLRLRDCFGLHVFLPPFSLPGFTLKIYWHERNSTDAAQAWFRSALLEIGRNVSAHDRANGI